MMKILRRSVKSIGRSKKASAGTSCIDDDGTTSTVSTPTTTTESKDTDFQEFEDQVIVNDFDSNSSSSFTTLREDSAASRSKSDLGSPISVLPSSRIDSALSDFEAFRFSYSKRRLECSVSKRSSSLRVEKQNIRRLCGDVSDDEEDSVEELDPYPTEVYNSDDESRCSLPVCNEELLSEGETEETIQKEPRMQRSRSCNTISEDSSSPDSEENIQKGWPLMHRCLSLETFNLPLGKTLDRSMSVVDWALQLPKRSGELSEKVCIRQELRKAASHPNHLQSDILRAQVRFSFSLPHVRTRTLSTFAPDRLTSLTSQIHHLCRDRPRVYTYDELDRATSGFSPSTSSISVPR